jgi:predicted nucleotide-binding protein
VVIIHEDGAGFALLVDTEHLDAEFVDVCRRAASTAASRASAAAVTASRRNRPRVFIGATIF